MKTINLGLLIQARVKEKGMTVTDFARELGCCRRNAHDIFKRESFNTEKLKRISKILEYDFISAC